MAMLGGLSWVTLPSQPAPRVPRRLAIYYGYPSLVNGASGDIDKAARSFSVFDVVVLGDGVEFPDQRSGRSPAGVGPDENQKARRIISALAAHHSAVKVYGYVCLGDSQRLPDQEIQNRVRLWKDMGVAGIFLDEAGYDWKIVDRQRQNTAITFIHSLGLSAFPNAFYPRDLFSSENLSGKNPQQSPPALDSRDLFLLESFQIENGAFEAVAEWQQRVDQAITARAKYGSHIFATTTLSPNQPFHPQEFSYAWWSAWLYDLDGFSWGEPNFAVPSGILPDRRCLSSEQTLLDARAPSPVKSDGVRFWRELGNALVVVDTADHSVHLVPRPSSSQGKLTVLPASSLEHSCPLACGEFQ